MFTSSACVLFLLSIRSHVPLKHLTASSLWYSGIFLLLHAGIAKKMVYAFEVQVNRGGPLLHVRRCVTDGEDPDARSTFGGPSQAARWFTFSRWNSTAGEVKQSIHSYVARQLRFPLRRLRDRVHGFQLGGPPERDTLLMRRLPRGFLRK